MNNALKEVYLRSILSGFTLKNGKLLVSKAFLIFKGMKDTIESLICQAKKNRSGKWASDKINDRLYVEVDSIPEPSRRRLQLDFPQDVIKEMLITHGHVEDNVVLDSIKAEAYLILTKEVNNFEKYLYNFYDLVPDKKERERLAKTYAILNAILPFIQKYPRGLIRHFYDVLKGMAVEHNIPLESANYYSKYIKRIQRQGLPQGLYHGLLGQPSNHLKLIDEIRALIIFFKTHGNPTSARQIQEDLSRAIRTNKNLRHLIEKIPDESTVRNFLADKESKCLTSISLLDYAAFEAKILGYLPTYKALNPLTRIFIDGYVIQIICGDDRTLKPITLVGVFIMDDYSRVVICEIGELEDHRLIGRAFFRFLTFTNFKIPFEIISDKFSAYQCGAFANFKMFLKKIRAKWGKSSNPKRKAPLERWFGSLQTMALTKIVGYKGEGIKSKRNNAHPSREVIITVAKKEFLKSKNEMIRILKAAVDDYNRNSFFSDAPSPFNLYRLKKVKHTIQLQHYLLPYFFWDKHEVSIRGSMVIIQKSYEVEHKKTGEEHIGGKEATKKKPKKLLKKWFYRNAEFDFSLRNGSQVDAYHCPEDDKMLYLFEPGSATFICIIQRQLVAKGASADQEELDRKIIADFGISKAALHQAYIDKIDQIQEKVRVMNGGKDPSELRERAQAKKDADQYVGNKVGITNATPEPNLFDAHKWKIGRKPVPKSKMNVHSKSGLKDTLSIGGKRS